MGNITVLVIELVVAVAAFAFGKWVVPNVPESVIDNLMTLEEWAAQLVRYAREFLSDKTGKKKMEKVVEMLAEIAKKAKIEVTEDQLKAIVQTAYEEMKAGEVSANVLEAEPLQGTFTPQNISIHIEQPQGSKVAVATDNVPEGALEENEDGTINTYNAAGEKTGTITKEEAEAAASDIDVVVAEE